MHTWAQSYRIQHASPESVFEWLQSDDAKSILDPYGDEQDIEAILLKRNEPLINLGLALYGQQGDIGQTLYRTGDAIIRRAVLGGSSLSATNSEKSWLIQENILSQLVAKWEEGCLETLLKNPHTPQRILMAVYRRQAPFDALDQAKWFDLVSYASLNTGFAAGQIGGLWLDDDIGELHKAAWSLFASLPVTQDSAKVLRLIAKLVPAPYYQENEVMSLIERWQSDNENKFAYVLQALVKLLSPYSDALEALKDSPVLALRKGYYAYRDFSFSHDHQASFKKDGGDFLDAVLDNDSVYFPLYQRIAIEEMCRKQDRKNDDAYRGSYIGLFEAKFRELINTRHHLFDFDENGFPYHLLNDKEERSDIRAEVIDGKVSAILGFLQGTPESGSFGYQLFRQLETITDLLTQRKQTTYAWVLGLAGLVAGYLLAKL